MTWAKTTASREARGYDPAHRKARAAAAKHHSPTDPCVRCGHPLGPMGPGLHYDHNNRRDGYLGFSHGTPCPYCGRKCNLRAGAIAGARKASRRKKLRKIINADRW